MRRKPLFLALGGVALVAGLVIADRVLFGFSGPLASLQRAFARAPAAEVRWSVVGRDFGGVTDIQFVPGSEKRALVDALLTLPNVTVPGPNSLSHVVVTAAPMGSPSSRTLPYNQSCGGTSARNVV